MTSPAQRQQNNYVKLLLLGDAKSGKTTSLAGLIEAGYKLRVLDYDNLIGTMIGAVEARCPDRLSNIEYRTLRDDYKVSGGDLVINGKPKAFADGIKMCENWKYTDIDGSVTDLGDPAKWGPESILVIDSLSRVCDAAYDYHESIIPRGKSGDFDGRAVYGNAQDAVEKFLASLTSDSFTCHTIVIAHGQYMDLPDGTTKIFPQGVGQKLSPKIPQYFPNYIRYVNKAGKRSIQFSSDPMIDLANTQSAKFDKALPTDELANFFNHLRGQPAKPASVQIKRVR